MFERLARRLRAGRGAEVRRIRARDLRLPHLHLPDLHLPDLHLRDLRWDEIASKAKGRPPAPEPRGGVILPTMLTLAGAGATLFWWRQWAQGRAESEAELSRPIASGAALDADLAVLGTADETSEPAADPSRRRA